MLAGVRGIIDPRDQRDLHSTSAIATTMFKNILVLLHIITAAGWFGLALIFGAVARKAAAAGSPAFNDVGSKIERFMTIFVIATFLFGLGAFFLGGGFGLYGANYHTSITLILILVLIQLFLIRPAWKAIAVGGEGAASSRKKLGIGIGVGHLLWLVVLILMLWNQYPLFR